MSPSSRDLFIPLGHEEIMLRTSDIVLEQKENFLLLRVEPYSHTLPWLRKANQPQLQGKPDRGTETQNPGEEDSQWRKRCTARRLSFPLPNFSAHSCPPKRDSVATLRAPTGFF